MNHAGVCTGSWAGLDWSSWTPVSERDQRLCTKEAGVYRIRLTGDTTLTYIGQSSCLSQRVRQIRYSLREQSPSVNHAVGRFARAMRLYRPGLTFEVSFATETTRESRHRGRYLQDKKQRLSVETYLMWRHRTETGISASCNHGRTGQSRHQHSQYPEPDNESPRVSTPGIQNSHPALPATGSPADLWWMGVDWEPFFSLHDRRERKDRHRYGSALYKIMTGDLETTLAVGYATQTWNVLRPLMDRLLEERSIRSVASVYQLHPGCCRIWRIVKYRCFEMRDDLLGGYHHLYGHAPVYQHQRGKLLNL
jgi:hypothetical protein